MLVNKFSHIKKTPELKIDVLLFENDNGIKKKILNFIMKKVSLFRFHHLSVYKSLKLIWKCKEKNTKKTIQTNGVVLDINFSVA